MHREESEWGSRDDIAPLDDEANFLVNKSPRVPRDKTINASNNTEKEEFRLLLRRMQELWTSANSNPTVGVRWRMSSVCSPSWRLAIDTNYEYRTQGEEFIGKKSRTYNEIISTKVTATSCQDLRLWAGASIRQKSESPDIEPEAVGRAHITNVPDLIKSTRKTQSGQGTNPACPWWTTT